MGKPLPTAGLVQPKNRSLTTDKHAWTRKAKTGENRGLHPAGEGHSC